MRIAQGIQRTRCMEFVDKVAVVTGGGRGIGRAAALTFAREGAAVAVVDRNGQLADEVAAEISGISRGLAIMADVSKAGDIDAFASVITESLGGIDFLFANAGAPQPAGALLDVSPETWDQQIAVNLSSVYLSARSCLPSMISRGGGSIIATSSDCAVRTCAEAASYVAAKHGVIGLVRSIAVDYGPVGVRANVVVPGVTETPGYYEWNSAGEKTPDSQARRAIAISPLGRLGQPKDLAEVVVFLCSTKASFITGATVMVDGGMTLTYAVD
jgi:NAD(P)-dependent dehydrogenase (short-subunit alcohol dehydrogenase family)